MHSAELHHKTSYNAAGISRIGTGYIPSKKLDLLIIRDNMEQNAGMDGMLNTKNAAKLKQYILLILHAKI